MGYEIEFLGANNEPLAYCKAEMSINGLPTSEYPWQADENGRIVFPPSLVEQEGKELRIKVVFWNEQYPKTEHSEIPEFTWIKGKRLVRLRAYNIYEIKPRTIPNEKGEPETYKRPYHIVEQGDTWEIIEKEAGVNRYALIWENGLDEATPLSSLVGQKIYFPKGMRDGKNKLKPTKIQNNSSVSHEHKKEINQELDNKKIKMKQRYQRFLNKIKKRINHLRTRVNSFRSVARIMRRLLIKWINHAQMNVKLQKSLLLTHLKESTSYLKNYGILFLLLNHTRSNHMSQAEVRMVKVV